MAVVVFAATYLFAAGIYWARNATAIGHPFRSGFIAVEVWDNYDKAKVAVATEASAVRAIVLLAGTFPEEQKTLRLVDRHIEVAVNEGWPAMARHRMTLSTLPTSLIEALKPADDAAYFHNDDMALAAYKVMEAHDRTSIKIGGCDAMPPSLQAVMDGRMVATVRNQSCLIHGGAILAVVAAVVSGEKTGMGPGMIPKHIVTDGPVVTKANAPGLVWIEEHFLI